MEITSRKEEMKRKREKQDIATALDLSGFSFHKIQIQWGRNHTSWGLLWPLLASNPQWGLPVIWPPWGLTGAPGQGVGHCIQCASNWWKFWTPEGWRVEHCTIPFSSELLPLHAHFSCFEPVIILFSDLRSLRPSNCILWFYESHLLLRALATVPA